MVMRIDFLGTPLDDVDIQDALQQADEFICSRRPHHIVVTNANKFWLIRHDQRLKGIVDRADLILPERAIALCSAILGKAIKGDVAGVAFAQALLPYCEDRGYSIYFLGASDEVQASLLEMVRDKYPRLKVAGCHHGFFLKDKNDFVLEDIRQSAPDVLLVAMGSPLQEYWIRENIDIAKMSVPVSIGVGGSFDVIAGLKKDAPQWVRKSGFEWLFRGMQDPAYYWKRYLRIVPYLTFAVLLEGMLGFRRSKKNSSKPAPASHPQPASASAMQSDRADA